MQNTLKVGLIGCGRIAGHHCNSIAKIEGLTVSAICDLEIQKAKPYGEEFMVPCFTNYHEMLKTMPEIDIVAIITPSGMHFEHTLEVLKYYKKHVVIEKPTFMKPSQLNVAYQEADRVNKKIFPVFQNRYNKAVARVLKGLQSGELGSVRLVSVRLRWCRPQKYYDLAPWRGTFALDGGALTNQTIHHVDLIRYLGGEIQTTTATMQTFGANIEVEDSTVATFSYVSGAIGVLESTTAARPDDFEASISLVCSEGLAQIGGIAVNELQIFTPEPGACEENSEDFMGITGHGAVYGFGHTQMYRDIVSDLKGDQSFPIDQNDCLQTLSLLHAFYRSDESQARVNVTSQFESKRLGRSDEALAKMYRTPYQHD